MLPFTGIPYRYAFPHAAYVRVDVEHQGIRFAAPVVGLANMEKHI